jgi:DUF177 domain-containing protein
VLITPQELELHRIVVSKTYEAGDIDYRGADFRQAGALEVGAVAELEGAEIRIRGHLAGGLEAVCARCLSQVEVPVDRDFDLRYRRLATIARGEEIEVPRDELEVGFYRGEGVVLGDVIAEQVILAVPMKILCRPDCQGLCAVCGINRNFETCHCALPHADSPFASLK